MYYQFFGLARDPFRLTPDGQDVYSHPSFDRARAYLEYGLLQAEGFVVVSGPPGSGKTTLSRSLIDQLPTGTRIAEVVTSRLDAVDLLRMVASELSLAPPHRDKASVIQTLRDGLVALKRSGHRALVLVDEAQDLPADSLEELRLLTNLTDNNTPLLQILLLGQPGLLDMLRRPEMEQFLQRTIASCRLEPLTREQTAGYVQHRLRAAGWRGDPVLTRAVLELLHHAAGGVPRRINLISGRLLLYGYAEGVHRLGVAELLEVLGEMNDESVGEWEPVAQRLSVEELAEPEPELPEWPRSGSPHSAPVTEPDDSAPVREPFIKDDPVIGAGRADPPPWPASGDAFPDRHDGPSSGRGDVIEDPIEPLRGADDPLSSGPRNGATAASPRRRSGWRMTLLAVVLVAIALAVAAGSIIPLDEILPGFLDGLRLQPG